MNKQRYEISEKKKVIENETKTKENSNISSSFQKDIPKFFRMFYYMPFWIVVFSISILFEVFFRSFNEQYRNRPISPASAFTSQIIIAVIIILSVYFFSKFSRKMVSDLDEVIDRFIKPNENNEKEIKFANKLFNILKISSTILILLFLVIGILYYSILISIKGVGLNFPNNIMGYVSVIYNSILFVLYIFTSLLISVDILLKRNLVISVIRIIDYKKIQLSPIAEDPTGGFKKITINQFLISLPLLIIPFVFFNFVYSSITNTSFFHPNILVYSEESVGIIFAIVFTIIAILIILALLFITILSPQFKIYKLIENYKLTKLNPYYKKKYDMINELFSRNKNQLTNKEMNKLQKYNLIIQEIKNINSWYFKWGTVVTFIISIIPVIIQAIYWITRIR